MKSELFPLIKCVRGKRATLSAIPKVEKLHGSCLSLYDWGGVVIYSGVSSAPYKILVAKSRPDIL